MIIAQGWNMAVVAATTVRFVQLSRAQVHTAQGTSVKELNVKGDTRPLPADHPVARSYLSSCERIGIAKRTSNSAEMQLSWTATPLGSLYQSI